MTRFGRCSKSLTVLGSSRMALIGQQPSRTASGARINVGSGMAESTTALKNSWRWWLGNGLQGSLEIVANVWQFEEIRRNPGDYLMQGISGMKDKRTFVSWRR